MLIIYSIHDRLLKLGQLNSASATNIVTFGLFCQNGNKIHENPILCRWTQIPSQINGEEKSVRNVGNQLIATRKCKWIIVCQFKHELIRLIGQFT